MVTCSEHARMQAIPNLYAFGCYRTQGLGRGFRGARRRRRRHNRAERAAARQPGAGIVSSVCVGVWVYWAAPDMRVNGLYRW